MSQEKVAVASADGRAYCLAITNDQPEVVQEWSESRWTASQKYVGLAISDRYVVVLVRSRKIILDL